MYFGGTLIILTVDNFVLQFKQDDFFLLSLLVNFKTKTGSLDDEAHMRLDA